MRLNRLHISRPWTGYGDKDKDTFQAEIEFENAGNKVCLRLDDQVSRKLLAVVAEEVVRAGQQTARDMLATVIDAAQPAIEDKTEEIPY